ncbi:hypothetical protein F5Y07DRAFT_406595 [Xylaria sp. FL0933]|nr:hypothetical protein F5Y07DRAFT_406595 [Xylaria sp. FL0933]
MSVDSLMELQECKWLEEPEEEGEGSKSKKSKSKKSKGKKSKGKKSKGKKPNGKKSKGKKPNGKNSNGKDSNGKNPDGGQIERGSVFHRFMDLPAELRLEIWELALLEPYRLTRFYPRNSLTCGPGCFLSIIFNSDVYDMPLAKLSKFLMLYMSRLYRRLLTSSAIVTSARSPALSSSTMAIYQLGRICGAIASLTLSSAAVLTTSTTCIPNPFFDPKSADTIETLQQGLLETHKGSLNVLDTNLAAIIGTSSAFLHLLQKGNVRRGWPAKKLQATDTNTRSLGHSQSNVDPGDTRTSQNITTSSMGGIQRSGLTGLAYTASKAGVVHLGQTLSAMLAPWNIRSNVCIPGYYHSEMTAPLPVMQNMRFGNTPAGRAGNPHDVAGFFLFLVGMSGSFVMEPCYLLMGEDSLSIRRGFRN